MDTPGKKKVVVHLYTQSEPIVYEDVLNTYQKGDQFCVMLSDDEVHKYPLQHIFRVIEKGNVTYKN